jgi:uncharacterized membrane protein YGL010W
MENAMLGGRSSDEWIAQYAKSHQHPINRVTHTVGIPMIVVSLVLAAGGFVWPMLWPWAIGLFLVGWVLQFVGHWFEGKPPEFLHDWRFLFVGVRWWLAKMAGKA